MQKQPSRADRVFDYFMDREGHWVDTFVLEKLGGRRSWRTRVSDARKRARLLRRDIVNRQRRQRIGTRTWTLSEYSLIRVEKRKAA